MQPFFFFFPNPKIRRSLKFYVRVGQGIANLGWNGILALIRDASPHIKFLIGNGHLIKFWTDPCLNGGHLKDYYGDRVISNMGLNSDIRVSLFIQNEG